MPCMEETKLHILRGTTLLDVRKAHPLICVGSTHISVTGEPVQAYPAHGRRYDPLRLIACFQPTAQGGAMTCIRILPFTDRQLSVRPQQALFPIIAFINMYYTL